MSNIEKYPKCHMRTDLGNCYLIGEFCPRIDEAICEMLHRVAKANTWHWILKPMLPDIHRYECPNCHAHHRERYDFCPSCGKCIRSKEE